MKKIVSILMALIMAGALSACGGNQESAEPTTVEKRTESKSENENSLKPLEILDFGYAATEILEDQTIIHYGVKVKNPNPEHAVQFPVIYVTAKDSLGNELYTQYAPLSAIAAGDTIMYGGMVIYEDEEPATVDVSVSSLDLSGGYILQEESTAIYQDELVVSDVSEQKSDNGKAVKFTGNVTNTSKYDIDGNFVVSVVFFEDDKIIGGYCSYFENLESGETMPFELDLSYLVKELRNYDHYEIYVGQ